mmetsp:Transcript_33746/g.81816  ORF Transcript_33746/g.81816 Transcript_33746/m.81816 type:complete len:1419 (+) Transcript_33746:672-4928(+)
MHRSGSANSLDGGSEDGDAFYGQFDSSRDELTMDESSHQESSLEPSLTNSERQDPSVVTSTLMRGGMSLRAPSPRLAIIVGTRENRVISIEFSIKPDSLVLERRKFFVGPEERTYFEPLPSSRLTKVQQKSKAPSKTTRRSSLTHSLTHSSSSLDSSSKKGVVPFEPSGGVTTLVAYNLWREGRPRTHVWISFGDGTAIRLHHAGFFPSVWQKHLESENSDLQLAQKVLGEPLVKWKAMLPPMPDSTVTYIPLPKYHPSPLAPFPAWKRPEFDHPTAEDEKLDEYQDEVYEAAVYCSGAMADVFPTLAFYTSEDQFESRIHNDNLLEDVQEEEEYGIVGSVIGGIFGSVFGSSITKKNSSPDLAEDVAKAAADDKESWDPSVPFPDMNLDPVKLYAGYEIHDPPRQIIYCTIDPEGDLAAIADTLGRVSLVDLATKQIIRMWKGFRDSVCHWIQYPRSTSETPWLKNKVLYLVIHSRQRKVIEVYRTRHGPRVKTIQVGRDAQLISSRELTKEGYVSNCYIVHSNVPHSPLNKIQKIEFSESEQTGNLTSRSRSLLPPDSPHHKSAQDAAMKLNHLKQLLDETNVECESGDVFRALENIDSIEDLATILDFVAKAPTLEGRMGVEGSTFQKLAVSYCEQKLDEAISAGGKEAESNPHIQRLAFKIAYYTQISAAYDALHRYEVQRDESEEALELAAPSIWSVEAAGWTAAYEKITKRLVDDDCVESPKEPLHFHSFAAACVPPKDWMEAVYDLKRGGYKVYLSDSSKTRKEILVRIFKPLLGDVFSFKVVNQLFDALGIGKDYDYLLKCFGEWFTSLSVKDSTTKSIFAKDSPANRWLKELAVPQIQKAAETDTPPMQSLYDYCSSSEELVRVFWLATLCREVVYQASTEMEDETYGKVSKDTSVGSWDSLLRKLRVCLFVSLRLYGQQLGACPISIKAVEKGDNFSVFEWLARDELSMTQNNDEIISLENACRISNHSFDPSKEEGDDRFKVLQKSCFSSALSEDERAEYLVDFDDDDRLGAMLLFMKPHNIPDMLVAHRTLLLAHRWGKNPADLTILHSALVALKSIDPVEHKRIASSLRLDIWQSRVRPVYRALLMGFDDVQEVSQEIVAPLFHDPEWVKALNEIAAYVLDLLAEIKWHESERIDLWDTDYDEDSSTWPPVGDCVVLKRLVKRNRAIFESALDAHRMLLKALKLSKNISSHSQCIPSFYDLFTPSMMFNNAVSHPEEEEKQHSFLQEAIVTYARNYEGPNLESLSLGEVESLADLWEFDMVNVRTLFLLSMYEFGKDNIVDEVLTKSASLVSVQHFCDDGVEIICRRLDYLMGEESPFDVSNVIGSLDADMCDWVREKAEESDPLVDGGILDVPIGSTHLFGLRLLSLAASAEIAKDERVKIHSLIVLSGTIVKSLEDETASSGT